MSVFADAYSRYLTFNFNYINRAKLFRKYFRNSIIFMTDPRFIAKDFINHMDTFPKYPYFLNAIVSTDSIDLVKIYNSSLDNTSNLLESMIGSSELSKKKLYDSIPSNANDILKEICFQFSYISDPQILYNYDLITRSFISENQYRNFFSDLYTNILFYSSNQMPGETAGLEEKAFSYEYMLYVDIFNLVLVSHNIYSKTLEHLTYINSYGMNVDRIDKAAMITGFQTFVNNYHQKMSIDLVNVIGKSIYGYQQISTTMIQNLNTIIDNKLIDVSTGLTKVFTNLMNSSDSLLPIKHIISNTVNHLNSFITVDIVSRIYGDSTIVDQGFADSEKLFETNKYNEYVAKISESQLKNYLFLAFLYKFWPVKFLNIIQLTLKDYTETYIKSTNDNIRTKKEFANVFSYFNDNLINYVNLKAFLDNLVLPHETLITYPPDITGLFTFTPGTSSVQCSDLSSYNAVNVHDYIYAFGDDRINAGHVVGKNLETLTLILDNEYSGSVSATNIQAYKYTYDFSGYIYNIGLNYNISEFGCFMYYDYVLDIFLNSTYFNTFVEDLVETIFIYLRDSGHVFYKFDWFEYHEVVKIYFKTYLRWKLLDKSTLYTLPTFTNAKAKFTNGSSYVRCADLATYNKILDGDYIFAKEDTIDNACQVLAHIDSTNLIIQLVDTYTGTTTSIDTYTNVYGFTSTDTVLFDNVTQNFANKLFPKILSNSTFSTDYDIDIVFPSATAIQSRFTNFSTSTSFISGMHQFVENLQLSTLTREIIYSMLTEFIPEVS